MTTTHTPPQANDPADQRQTARALGKVFLDELDNHAEHTTTGIDTAHS